MGLSDAFASGLPVVGLIIAIVIGVALVGLALPLGGQDNE